MARKIYIEKKEKERGRGWVGFEGSEHPTSKKVVQYSKGGGKAIQVWDSLRQASDFLHITRGNITKCCQGKRKTAGGFKWAYKYPTLQRVWKLSLKGEKIKAYNTIIVAAGLHKTNEAGILKCCMGEAKQAGGFLWTFKNR